MVNIVIKYYIICPSYTAKLSFFFGSISETCKIKTTKSQNDDVENYSVNFRNSMRIWTWWLKPPLICPALGKKTVFKIGLYIISHKCHYVLLESGYFCETFKVRLINLFILQMFWTASPWQSWSPLSFIIPSSSTSFGVRIVSHFGHLKIAKSIWNYLGNHKKTTSSNLEIVKSVDESVLLSGPFILAAITTALIYSFLCSAIFNGEILKQPNAGTKSEFFLSHNKLKWPNANM